MAFLGSGRFGWRSSRGLPGWPGDRTGKGRVVLRTQSRRAFSFEMHPREAVSDLGQVAAVYAYARAVPADASGATVDASAADFQIGYVGQTDDMAARDAQHGAAADFAGHAFDLVLVLRIDEAPIRESVSRELCETYRPVLNDLLRGREAGETC